MFLKRWDVIGKQIQLGFFFNPTYMFIPLAGYDVSIGHSKFIIFAFFGVRIMMVQTE